MIDKVLIYTIQKIDDRSEDVVHCKPVANHLSKDRFISDFRSMRRLSNEYEETSFH